MEYVMGYLMVYLMGYFYDTIRDILWNILWDTLWIFMGYLDILYGWMLTLDGFFGILGMGIIG